MSTNTYKATMDYYDSSWGWKGEGTASQGQWDGTGVRTGVLYFAGLSALKGKIINSVSLTVTTGETGYGLATTKTAYIYNSASQGGIHTSLNAGHKTGNAIGSVKSPMWGNTKTFTVSFMASSITSGYDTYCIYNGSSYNDYLKWTSASITVDWSEPATQPVLSASSVNMGSSVTITTTATNSAYRHRLWYSFGSATGTIATDVAGSHSWTPPLDLAKQIPSTTVGYGTVYCETYSGSTYLGTKSVSIALYVPSSVKPSAGTLSATINSDTSGTGKYVKGMCKAHVALSGSSGAYGSTISSYSITGGGYNVNSASLTTGVLTTSGTITFTASVTDSRGRTSNSVTCKITVLDYTKPSVSNCKVYRCDSSGNAVNAGTSFAIECTASYSSGISGNTLAINAKYKKSSDSSYSAAISCTNGSKKVVDGNLSTSSTYDVQITVSDKYNSVTLNYTLPTKSTLLSFIKNAGAAIGKVAELKGWLDIQWNTRIRSNLQVDGTISSADQHRIKWQTIPDGADLNDEAYRMPGHYRSTSGTNVIANAPPWVKGAFEMVVTGIADGTYCTQTVKDYRDNYRYVRTQTNWQTPWIWTDWTWYLIPADLNNYAKLQSPNNLIHTGNEFTFVAPNFNNDLWLNYRTASGNTDGNIGTYMFGNGKKGLAKIKVAGITAPEVADSGWQNASITGSFSLYGSDSVLRYRKIGHVVQVEGTLRPSTTLSGSATDLTIFTLPDGYRPSAAVVALCQGSGACHWTLTIKANGAVCFGRYSSGGSYTSAGTGTWLPFHHTFMV